MAIDEIQIPFSDDEEKGQDDALLTDDDDVYVSPEDKVTRKQKRSDRIKRLLDEGKQSSEKVKTLESEQQNLRGELERLKGYLAAQAPQTRQSGKSEFEQRLDAVYEKQSNAYAAAQAELKAGTMDEKRSRHYEQIAREIETEKSRIHAEEAVARNAPVQQQNQAQQVWAQKYPDIYSNPNAFQYAQATFHRRKSLGENITNEVVDEIMGETLAQFRLGPKKSPSQNDKARLSGISSSGSGGGQAGPGVTMTKELRKMAISLYSDLPEEEAVKKWANSAGKELRKQKVL